MNKFQSPPLAPLLASLYDRINYERQLKVTPRHFKLRNMREFLRRLGNPHLQYPVIHVAGTKGKGSVVTMIGQILQSSGRRTGVYLSPHLETIHQRMGCDNHLITDQQLADVLTQIQPVADAMDREAGQREHRKLTFFEIITAAAFCFFAKQKSDAVVLEVGLGGRMDSTNVCQPAVTVITNISFDHTRQLGTTLEKIAGEKAGIIKPNVPVISGVTQPGPASVIQAIANENNSPLYILDQDFQIISPGLPPSRMGLQTRPASKVSGSGLPSSPNLDPLSPPFSIKGQIIQTNHDHPIADQQPFEVNDIRLKLIGSHQETNAALSVAAVQALNQLGNPSGQSHQSGWQITDEQIRSGLAAAQLPGRTELISTHPPTLLDIAHNPASVTALINTLKQMPQWNSSPRKTLILAISRDKDTQSMLRPLLTHFDHIILTKFQNNPRGVAAEELLEIAKSIQLETASEETIVDPINAQPINAQPINANPINANPINANPINANPINAQPANSTGHDGAVENHPPTFAQLTLQPTPAAAWETATANRVPDEFLCIAGSAFLVAELRPVAKK